MAKTQTFGDKAKKKKLVEVKPNVKVVKWFRDDDGGMRLHERFVKVDDLNSLDKIEVK